MNPSDHGQFLLPLPCCGSGRTPPDIQADAEGVCRRQGLADRQLGLVGVSWEELALDVVLGLWSVARLQELKQLSEAGIFYHRHWLQILHDHLSDRFGDQNLQNK